MQQVDYMDIIFRGRAQRRRFEVLAKREMALTIYPNSHTMTSLGIRDSVMFLLDQIGWNNFTVGRRFSSYRRLTLEFLSSLTFMPDHGLGFNQGLIILRMIGIDFRYNS